MVTLTMVTLTMATLTMATLTMATLTMATLTILYVTYFTVRTGYTYQPPYCTALERRREALLVVTALRTAQCAVDPHGSTGQQLRNCASCYASVENREN